MNNLIEWSKQSNQMFNVVADENTCFVLTLDVNSMNWL